MATPSRSVFRNNADAIELANCAACPEHPPRQLKKPRGPIVSEDSPQNPYGSPATPAGAKTANAFTCESCGSTKFTRVKPEAGFAFAKDFMCVNCKEQVPAPVPNWGRVLMVVCGGCLAMLGALWIYVNIGHLIPMLIGSAMLYFGGRSAIAGLR